MNKSFLSLDDYQQRVSTEAGVQQRVPDSLRRQARWATYLFLTTWLFLASTVFLVFDSKFIDLLALLPGLAIAGYMQRLLSHNLSKNYRTDEPGEILPELGAGNWITLLRATAVVGLAALLPLAIRHDPQLGSLIGWLGGCLYLAISLADLFDGYAARQQNQVTELGKVLDMETDAVGLLAASVIGISLGRLPEIYLLVGLAYYLFKFGIWWRKRHDLPVVILQYRPHGRIIAGCQMGLVALVLMPVFTSPYTQLAAIIFMLPLVFGFLRDWLVVSSRLATDDNQKSRLDAFWRRGTKQVVSLLARVLIAINGVVLLMAHELSTIGVSWLMGFTICSFLIVFGCMGRSLGILLMMLLALNQSPFGVDVITMLSFGAAAVVVVLGSGPLSLWAPENDIFYRRRDPKTRNGLETK